MRCSFLCVKCLHVINLILLWKPVELRHLSDSETEFYLSNTVILMVIHTNVP